MTETRKEMMGILKVADEEQYIKIIESIAWWYLWAMKNDYEILATKATASPIINDELELPYIINEEGKNE